MPKHAETLDDWKVVRYMVVSYVLLWRVRELVLWRPKKTGVQGATLWNIKRSRRLAYS